MLWNSIPSQLAKENKKFIYGLISEGARAKEYETALLWLSDCGLVHKVSRVNAPNLPLKAEVNLKAKRLKTYREKFQPETAVRTSMADYKEEAGLVNLPLYCVEEMAEVLQKL